MRKALLTNDLIAAYHLIQERALVDLLPNLLKPNLSQHQICSSLFCFSHRNNRNI